MKSLRKRLGRRLIRYKGHFTKYLYERDTIFATIWVFIFIIGLSTIKLNTYFLNPLKLVLQDFDMNDLAYSNLEKSKNTPLDNNIVIVNIGHADREVLSMVLDKVASYHPRVIGMDVIFNGEMDSYQDSLLNDAINRNKDKLVLASQFVSEGDTIFQVGNYFKGSHYGFVNMDTEDDLKTTRTFSPFKENKEGEVYNSFPVELVRHYDPSKFQSVKKRNKTTELINFQRKTNQYWVVDYEKLLEGGVETDYLKDRIVLLGYINTSPFDIEDKKFTPMNSKFAGKAVPDMNGIVVHANVISMILEKNYIKKLPSWVNWLVAILIGWLHMSFFVRYYLENHIWFHLVAKIAQILSAVFFSFIAIQLFARYNIKLDIKLSLIVIVLAVDVIYFYEAFAVWMHKKFKYHTVFHQKHH